MDSGTFQFIVGSLLAIGVPLTGWVFTMIFTKLEKQVDKHDDLESRFEAHRLYAAETFPTKIDVEKGFDRILDKLDAIDVKLDMKVNRNELKQSQKPQY